MAEKTGIEWTDRTWNPWQGCKKVSAGCKNCYMYREKKRYGQDPAVVVRSKTTFNAPLKWKAPARVFTCSWSDFFIPQADPWRDEAWDIIRRTPHLTYQILTKRPERIEACLPQDWGNGYRNVWLGISAESGEWYDRRWPILLEVPAAVRFLSAEPLLGPIWFSAEPLWFGLGYLPDWVIAGAETGAGARFTDIEWIRGLRRECGSDVPLFVKQITVNGRKIPFEQWPEDLQVRQFPEVVR